MYMTTTSYPTEPFGKVTLIDPDGCSTTHTTACDDERLDGMLSAGWTVYDSWTVYLVERRTEHYGR
jgi:hypothetical protein